MKRVLCGAALVFAGAAPAWAQGKLDAATMKAFGGTYQIECGNNASSKATVFPDALVFRHGDKRVAGSRPESQTSYYGNSPPPEYRIMLVSEAPGGQLMFAIHEDKSGYYLKVDGDAKVAAAIGKPLTQQKFRHCDGSARPVQVAAAPAPSKAPSGANAAKIFKGYALTELSAPGLLYNPQAKATYTRALGPLSKEPWLARLDGPSPQNRPVRAANADYVLLAACKNHDCAQYNTVLLYSATQDVVYGKVYQRGRSTLIGSPPPAVAAELEKLWKLEFRSQPK